MTAVWHPNATALLSPQEGTGKPAPKGRITPVTAPESAAMTTSNTKAPAKRGYVPGHPGEAPDDMTSARAIRLNGNSHSLRVHYADRPNTIVDAEHYISQIPTRDMTGVVYPDLLIAFGARPGRPRMERRLRHIRAWQAPDFVLEVASRSTRTTD